jgi:hypothetical protein
MKHVVLLGDSIFDNASYVPDGPPVIKQLRHRLSPHWQATLLAVDGHMTADVIGQTSQLPTDATHCVISCGGNDALRYSGMLYETAHSVAEVLDRLSTIRVAFQRDYRTMLAHTLRFTRPVAVCTVYDAIPGFEPWVMTALAIFNEIILREAFLAHVPVIDLRLICNEAADYSALSPIEPSVCGGEKIVQAIVHLLENHDFTSNRSAIYT